MSTSRPPLVLIRTRNPWVLFRLRLFGWKVRFIFVPLVSVGAGARTGQRCKANRGHCLLSNRTGEDRPPVLVSGEVLVIASGGSGDADASTHTIEHH